MIDIATALRELLEPDPTDIATDLAVERPLIFAPHTLYLYPLRNAEVPFETGPTARQDFSFVAAILDDSHEEAGQERRPEVSAWLDEKRQAYFAAVRANRTTPTWHHLQAAESRNPPRTLQARGLAIEISGYRFV